MQCSKAMRRCWEDRSQVEKRLNNGKASQSSDSAPTERGRHGGRAELTESDMTTYKLQLDQVSSEHPYHPDLALLLRNHRSREQSPSRQLSL